MDTRELPRNIMLATAQAILQAAMTVINFFISYLHAPAITGSMSPKTAIHAEC